MQTLPSTLYPTHVNLPPYQYLPQQWHTLLTAHWHLKVHSLHCVNSWWCTLCGSGHTCVPSSTKWRSSVTAQDSYVLCLFIPPFLWFIYLLTYWGTSWLFPSFWHLYVKLWETFVIRYLCEHKFSTPVSKYQEWLLDCTARILLIFVRNRQTTLYWL